MDKELYIRKPKRFKTPEDLWEEFCNYMEYCENNPWTKYESTKQGIVPVPVGKPLTFTGFASFVGLTTQGLMNYGEMEGREAYFEIYARIRDIIDNHQFEGAAVGVYNHSLIARRLGLVDKTDNTTKIEVTDYSKIPEEEIQARAQAIKERKAKENERKENNS